MKYFISHPLFPTINPTLFEDYIQQITERDQNSFKGLLQTILPGLTHNKTSTLVFDLLCLMIQHKQFSKSLFLPENPDAIIPYTIFLTITHFSEKITNQKLRIGCESSEITLLLTQMHNSLNQESHNPKIKIYQQTLNAFQESDQNEITSDLFINKTLTAIIPIAQKHIVFIMTQIIENCFVNRANEIILDMILKIVSFIITLTGIIRFWRMSCIVRLSWRRPCIVM